MATNQRQKELLGLVQSIYNNGGVYNAYSNALLLIFLKYIITYPEEIGGAALPDTYKKIYEFTKAMGLAKKGEKPLDVMDFRGILSMVDDKLAYQNRNIAFVDFADEYERLFTQSIRSQQMFLDAIDKFSLNKDADELKDIIEVLFDRAASDVTKTGGFTTSRSLRKIASSILNVQNGETYLDCFCGYSSSLLSTNPNCEYVGYDIDPRCVFISQITELLLGRKQLGSLNSNFFFNQAKNVAEKVFSDGPIAGAFEEDRALKEFGTKTFGAIVIYRTMAALKENGTAVVTCPARTLFSSAKGFVDARKAIIDCGLKAVIELPPLWSGTNVGTNLLVLQDGYKGNIQFISAKDLYLRTRSGYEMNDEQIERVIQTYNDQQIVPGFSAIKNREEVNEKNLLTPNLFIELPTNESSDYRELKDIDQELDSLYAELKKNI